MPNIFANIPADLPEELTEVLCERSKSGKKSNVRIERIVSRGHRSPEGFWYDSDKNEWVLLLKGSAAIEFEDTPVPLELLPGDYLNIPAHTKHRVERTAEDEDSVWLAIHYG